MSTISANVSADTSKFKQGIEQAKRSIQQFKEEVAKASKTTNNFKGVTNDQIRAFEKSVGAIEKATAGTKTYKQSASALEKELQKLNQQWSNLSKSARESSFGKAMANQINQTKNKINELNAAAENTSHKLKSLGSSKLSFNSSSFDALSGAIGKIGGAVAIAEGAFKVFKDAMRSTEEGIDSWDSKIKAAETTYSRFVAAVGRGDLKTAFSYQNIVDSWNLGQKAYNASDNKSTYVNTMKLYNQDQQFKISELRRRRAEGETITKEDIQPIIDAREKYISGLRSMIMDEANRNLEASWNEGAKGIKFNNSNVQNVLSLIRHGGNANEILNGERIPYKEIEKQQALVDQLVNEITAWEESERNRILDNKDQFPKFWEETEKIKQEADRRREEILNGNDYKKLQDMIHYNENQSVTSIIKSNEGGLVEYINLFTELRSQEKEVEDETRALYKLLEKDSKEVLKKGTIAYYDNLKKEIQTKMDKVATTPDEYKKYKAIFDDYEHKIKLLKGELESSVVEKSIADYKKQIADLEKELSNSTDNQTYQAVQEKIDELKDLIRQIEGKASHPFQFNEYQRSDKSVAKETKVVKYDFNKDVNSLKSQINITKDLVSTWKSAIETSTALKSKQHEVNNEFLAGKLSVEEYNAAMSNMRFENFMTMFDSISSGISQTIDSVIKFAEACQTAAEMQQAASAATMAASEGEALGKATASASGLPFPYNLAAIGTAVSTIIGMFASFASMSKFANGGIVGGGTSLGDMNLVRVNSGEMILNGSQQKHLFDMIDNNRPQSSAGPNLQDITWHIKGSDLYGAFNAYNNKMKRVR